MTNRKNFAKLKEVIKIPYLLGIQRESYDTFLQANTPKTKRKAEGLQGVFEEVFPIESNDGNYKLEFLYYTVGKPKYDKVECQKRAVGAHRLDRSACSDPVRLIELHYPPHILGRGDAKMVRPAKTFESHILSRWHGKCSRFLAADPGRQSKASQPSR